MSELNEEFAPPPLPVSPMGVTASPALDYVTETTYRPTGQVEVGGLLISLGAGLAVAFVAAIGAMLWMISGLPSWLFLPILAQGLVVGYTLSRLFRRYRFRSPAGAIVVGIVCGFASAVFFHAGLYVRNVYVVRGDMHRAVAAMSNKIKPGAAATIDAEIDAHPFRTFDQAIVFPATGHTGALGYLLLRGQKLWLLGLGQAAAIAWIAVKVGKTSASQPYCESCGKWYPLPYNAAIVPIQYTAKLKAAIEADDPTQVMALHHEVNATGSELGTACAIARVNKCEACGKLLARVHSQTYGGRSAASATTTPRRISPETLTALRYDPEDEKTAAASAPQMNEPIVPSGLESIESLPNT